MRYLGLSAALFVGVVSFSAWSDEDSKRLEGWQEQILRALEAAESAEPPADANRQDSFQSRGSRDPGAAAAAEKARKRYGGEPLAAVRVGDRFRVRLLFEDGRVITVDVAE